MDILEITLLDSYAPTHAIALARHGSDVAIAKIPLGPDLVQIEKFRADLLDVLRGRGKGTRPTGQQLIQFGRDLFDFLVRDDIGKLYSRLPNTQVSLKILVNQPALRQLPWEYLQEPNRISPRRGRSVVRIIPTVGVSALPPLPINHLTRVLFVYADPQGLTRVSWSDVRDALLRTYKARFPNSVGIEMVECTSRDSLGTALRRGKFDVVQFSCHGEVIDNKGTPEGRLILFDKNKRKLDFMTGKELAQQMAGHDIRLIVLSACDTSASTSDINFNNIAEDLILEGIPTVVANQAPVQDQTVAAFVGALYDELLLSGNIDMAVTAGRLQLATDLRDSPEWGIPTLYRIHGSSQMYQQIGI
ncbi:CHAT domain-containing protein [Tunturiibacter gelidoferens]|uniref:CHAT domain-containing protein n=1 Tax=Tunturiibacter gelidiferens TaxID=3069689 RepID=A0A9X0QFR5_9BACT|nr:CHAT domain-containing protein [Edaphobacter lichenicola]MBB5329428.1 hypothetical protein [Edaphobacter lichenicola]